ncbi:proline--tRNA ligase [mine drainage metagenome]|uniref:Proline--tRNA ligase n=1 Tax=mine drainage metagenome TaxID=410659 RepID=A0A1J5P9E7_9ZZZZ
MQDFHRGGLLLDERTVLPLTLAQELQAAGVALPKTAPLTDSNAALVLKDDNGDPTAFGKVAKLDDKVTTDPTDASGSPYSKANAYMMHTYLEHILPAHNPELSLVWLRNPDSTQHNYGPGTADARDALHAQDKLLGELQAKLKALHLAGSTDIVVVSDHGHSTVAGDASWFPLRVIADRTVARMADFVVGANAEDFHYTGVNWGRDLPEPEVADLREVVAGDPSPDGRGVLSICRGIEVGHVFYLGTKYSDAMGATYLDDAGRSQVLEMGCYGIGISRILGACIEQNHDARGMVWPDAIAPFEVVVCPIGYDRVDAVREAADALLEELLAAGFDAVLDDRGERPGAMFADWELIGVPHRVVLSDRGLKEGQVEYQGRRETEATKMALSEVVDQLRARLKI